MARAVGHLAGARGANRLIEPYGRPSSEATATAANRWLTAANRRSSQGDPATGPQAHLDATAVEASSGTRTCLGTCGAGGPGIGPLLLEP